MTTIVKRSIDAKTAEQAIEGAAKKAAEFGLRMCIAVTDEAGDLKAFRRMDGAPELSTEISHEQGLYRRLLRHADPCLVRLHQDDPLLLHGITHTPRLVVFGGGFPIHLEGESSAPSASAAATTPKTSNVPALLGGHRGGVEVDQPYPLPPRRHSRESEQPDWVASGPCTARVDCPVSQCRSRPSGLGRLSDPPTPPGGHLCGSALLRGEARKEHGEGLPAFDRPSTSDIYCLAAQSADTSRLRGEHPDIYV